jgi:hypothetical protein
MAEQRTLNPQVLGSTPRGRTTKSLGTACFDRMISLTVIDLTTNLATKSESYGWRILVTVNTDVRPARAHCRMFLASHVSLTVSSMVVIADEFFDVLVTHDAAYRRGPE